MKYRIEYELELMENPYPGRYIAIEGVDASGKTTQVEELKNYLEKKGKSVKVVSEPSDKGPTGKLIRDILAGRERIPLTAFQFIYTADRTIQFENDIIPALRDGCVVLSSRCFWSAIPYGVMDKGESEYKDEDANLLMMAQGILSMYHQFIAPDHTIYLKISAETACDRLSDMDKAKEIYEKKSKLEKLVKGYDWLSRKFPEEIQIVDGEQSIDNVTRDIIKVLRI
jgi:dTMP kinase